MSETQQTQVSDPSVSDEGGNEDASVEEASIVEEESSDVQQDDQLTVLNKVMGRNFKTLEEAQTHYQNLNKLVGDQTVAEQRKQAESFNKLVDQIARENKWSRGAAVAYLEELQTSSSTPQSTPPSSFDAKGADEDARIATLERELFLAQTPGAAKYIDKISTYAKSTHKSLREAYSDLYGDIIEATNESIRSEALKAEKQGAQVTASSSTPPPPSRDRYAELMEQYRKTGDQKIYQEAIKEKWNRNEGLKRASQNKR